MEHSEEIRKRLRTIIDMWDRFDSGDINELNLTVAQADYLKSVCEKLLNLAADKPVTNYDIDITMAILYERHEHYKEINQ